MMGCYSQISQYEGMLKSNKSIWRNVIVKEVNMKGCYSQREVNMKGCKSQISQYDGMLKSNKSMWRDVKVK